MADNRPLIIMKMQQYKLIVSYDGTDYAGWQYQPDETAVTNVLQDTFKYVFGKTIKLVGASRTDAGVHAIGQVAAFSTDLVIQPNQLLNAWNNRLPTAMLIRSLHKVSPEFYPMNNVEQKTYWYHVFGQRPSPFVQRFGHYMRYPLDEKKLENALKLFVGTHDFRSFTSDDVRENTVKTIDSISLHYFKRFNVHRIEFKAQGFLRYMIRRVVGACLEVASRPSLKIDLLQQVMDERDPEQTLPNAPAKGLLLYKVMYHRGKDE